SEAELEFEAEAETDALDLPSYAEATGGAGQPPIEMHCYHVGKSQKHTVVRDATKTQDLYFLQHPFKWSGKWDDTLFREREDGEPVGKITKGNGLKDTFEVMLHSDGVPVTCKHHGFINWTREFTPPKSDQSYCWVADSKIKHALDYSLIPAEQAKGAKEQRTPIARWRTPNWALKKSGTLKISPEYAHWQELILLTVLGVAERARETQTATNASVASSSGASAAIAVS
ncbi:hypothetical protein JCM10207_001604, partial [Rhodosporidiobolus poonsookiae]